MAAFDAQLGPEILAKAQAGSGEITGAISRTFDLADVAIEFAAPAAFATDQLAAFTGSGLGILLTIGSEQAAIVLCEAGGLLPDWYKSPDPTGTSKLTTFAQEFGMLLLPDEFMPEDFKAQRVADLAASVTAAAPTSAAGQMTFTITSGEKKCAAMLVWSLSAGKQLLQAADSNAPDANSAEKSAANTGSATPAITAAANQGKSHGNARVLSFEQLPSFTRSILKVRLPVRVALAHKRQPIDQIIELGPGSIIQFEKSCEEMLDLVVGDVLIAQGEAVKVGEKFGLRITSMVLPSERFSAVKPAA